MGNEVADGRVEPWGGIVQGGIVAVMWRDGGAVVEDEVEEVGGGGHKGEEEEEAPAGWRRRFGF